MKLIKTFVIIGLVFFLVIFSVGVFYYISEWLPALKMTKRENIQKIILTESPVHYENGEDVIGVFFHEEHRRYLKFEEIPKDFINAIVAAEDHSFYTHPGFDLKSILRALIVNIKSVRIVQGGSTITQQTAKNIFKRERRSFNSKIKELIHALVLELYYTKDEIIEFYSNQFFVNSNGRGIGVAAEYFFDKPASRLSLAECAFIAGAVKGPNRYNPFTKKTPADRERAISRAKQRRNYVFKNMYSLGMISLEEYEREKEKPIPFREGRIGYALNVILDYIREQLQSEQFRDILLEQGIDNIATSGLKIYTTLDKEIQEGALLVLRKNLSYLETKLKGYVREKLQERYTRLKGREFSRPRVGFFCFGKVSKVVRMGRASYIEVEFKGARGRIDYSGMVRLGNAWMKSRRGQWARFDERYVKLFLKRFRPGDLIFVHVKKHDQETGNLYLELEQRPEVEGGLVVLKNGQVKAMIGGFKNEFFNRAVDAKRQLGSIFKPIVYAAALQLDWNNLDALENADTTFEFQNALYSPRPDHEVLSSRVSMAWAGVKSENIATVWLLYHLCDRLDMNQFRHITEKVGLTRQEDESYEQYTIRIRDRNGVVVNDRALTEAAFEEAKKELTTDIIFEGEYNAIEGLKALSFEEFSGENYDGSLSPHIIDKLSASTDNQYTEIKGFDRYDFRVLSRIRDFRVLVGLRYVVRLARKMGISSKLDGVMSFPLGANAISILEASLAYHTILSGKLYPIGEDGSMEYSPIINKILDRHGEVVYEYRPRGVRVLDKRISNMVTPILRQAVKHGTGKRAEGSILVEIGDFGDRGLSGGLSYKIPAFGKTGTSNDFTNSSFCGFIPGPAKGEKGLCIEDGYVIASYVGYDNNRPLKNRHIKIYGASGALPVWIDTANTIVRAKRYSKHIDFADLVFQDADAVSLQKAPEMKSVVINTLTGLASGLDIQGGYQGEAITVESYGEIGEGGFVPNRFFLPFAQN